MKEFLQYLPTEKSYVSHHVIMLTNEVAVFTEEYEAIRNIIISVVQNSSSHQLYTLEHFLNAEFNALFGYLPFGEGYLAFNHMIDTHSIPVSRVERGSETLYYIDIT